MKTSNKNQTTKFLKLSIEACEDDNNFIYEDLGVSKEAYLNKKVETINIIKLKNNNNKTTKHDKI